MEHAAKLIATAAHDLDQSSDVIGAEARNFAVLTFDEWKLVCERGTADKTWLMSVLFYAERHAFYKTILYLKRHRELPVDPFEKKPDLVSIFVTGCLASSDARPDFQQYGDPHIRIREILFMDDDIFVYRQEDIESRWTCQAVSSLEDIVQSFFEDVFYRKAGLGA